MNVRPVFEETCSNKNDFMGFQLFFDFQAPCFSAFHRFSGWIADLIASLQQSLGLCELRTQQQAR